MVCRKREEAEKKEIERKKRGFTIHTDEDTSPHR
jgi:hypothetical protein